MISTLQALVAVLIGVLPGALYTFAYERVAGSFGVGLADRVIRFLGSSAIYHALIAGFTYSFYVEFVASGRLQVGDVSPFLIEMLAILYIGIPTLAGFLVGSGRVRGWRWTSLLSGSAPEPRAWDHVWRQRLPAVVRLRLKSGIWLAGVYAEFDGVKSYASGYPESGDLFLARQLEVDPDNGTFGVDPNGDYMHVPGESGLLIRWDEVEFMDYKELV